MILKLNKKFLSFSLVVLIILLIGVNSSVINYRDNSDFTNLKKSSYWNLSGNPIFIDDLNPTYNWETINATYDWCRGNGTVENPYIIENIYLDAQNLGSGIEIRNSNAYFTIKNCTFLSASLGSFPEFNAGISLENTNNGLIIGNNCSSNKCAGINIYNSDDNEIIDNTVSFNEWYGIRIYESDNNNLSENRFEDNPFNSPNIYLSQSLNTHIEDNKIKKNERRGIEISNSNVTTVIGNDVDGSLYLYSGSNNMVSGNNLTEGIYLNFNPTYSDYNTISGNDLGTYGLRVGMTGLNADEIATHNIIDVSNTVNDKPLYFYQNQNMLDQTDYIDPGQILLINCNHSKIENNNMSNSYSPIQVHLSDNCSVTKNNLTNCEYGIFCDRVTNSFFTNNILAKNEENGIYLAGSFNCSIINNTAFYSEDGIEVSGSNHSIKLNIVNNNYLGIKVGGNNHTVSGNSADNASIYVNGNNNFIGFNNASYCALDALIIRGDYNKIVHNLIEYNNFGGRYESTSISGDYLEISNNTVSNNYKQGITQWGENSTISGNLITNNQETAININSVNNTICDNIIVDNAQVGMIIGGTEHSVFDNYLANNGNYDIFFKRSYNVTLFNNQMYDNGIGIYDGHYENDIKIRASLKIDTSNTVNDAPIYYYANQTNLDEFDFKGAGQILLINCNSSTISNVDISSVRDAFIMYHCNFNSITSVSLTYNNFRGLYLYESHDCSISESTFNNNEKFGLHLRDSTNNDIFDNYINSNNIGVGIRDLSHNNIFYLNFIQSNTNYGVMINSSASENLFYNNTFNNPDINAYDDGTNTYWDNGSIGNYWHDYTGRDLNDDGIGDTPYNIAGLGGGSDNYPIWFDGDEPPETNGGDDLPGIPIEVFIYSIFFGSLVGVATVVVIIVRKRRTK